MQKQKLELTWNRDLTRICSERICALAPIARGLNSPHLTSFRRESLLQRIPPESVQFGRAPLIMHAGIRTHTPQESEIGSPEIRVHN